jgi:hypothetical protein
MVNTTDRAELQNCIRNAQDCMMKMGQMIDHSVQGHSREDLLNVCRETGILLQEAQQRCEKLM